MIIRFIHAFTVQLELHKLCYKINGFKKNYIEILNDLKKYILKMKLN